MCRLRRAMAYRLLASNEPQLRVTKTRSVFKSITERPIDPDVGEPNEGIGLELGICEKSSGQDSQWPQIAVRCVVYRCSDLFAGEICKEGKIWCKKQECE